MLKHKNNFITGVVAGFFIALLLSWPLLTRVHANLNVKNISHTMVKTVSAQELYHEFMCGCCDKPLDPQNICCGMARAMIDKIDKLVAKKMSREEILQVMTKEYGLDLVAREEVKQEIQNIFARFAGPNPPKISILEKIYDLGNVSAKGGVVYKDFEVINQGQSDLVIDKLDSSCGCTSANIIYNDIEGPKFYMSGHGHDTPQNWQVSVKPNEKAILRVYYDPQVHPDFRGEASRTITVFSNDPVNFSEKVRIELNQID